MYSDGNSVTYDYTPSGRVKTVTDSSGTIEKTYDSLGRLKSQTNPSGETIEYEYDKACNIVKIQTPTKTITKTYDALNRLKSVTDNKGTTNYIYDAIGRVTKVEYPNGVSTEYSYDSRNHITNITHKTSTNKTLQSFTYSYDKVGNRIKVAEDSGKTIEYSYNKVNQLIKELITNDPNGNNSTTTFTYDKAGNLVSKSVDGVVTTYTYNANNQLTQKANTNYKYDKAGNLISDGTSSYEYDSKNRLVKVITPTQTVEYGYDANDNRIAKTTSNGTTTYLVDSNTPYAQVITESKENGTKIEYTYGLDLISKQSQYYLSDALGSTRALVDSNQELTDSYSYTPYGKLANHIGSSDNSFLFTGEQFDSETENYYLRARYYSPNSGRFLSRDSYDGNLNNPLSQNHYLYASGNPLTYVDPSGHFTIARITQAITITGILATSYYAINIGRHSINTGLFDIFTSGEIGIFTTATVSIYIAQALEANPNLAKELDLARVKEKARVNRRRKNKKVLYHYTDRASAMMISFTGKLKVTPKHPSSNSPRGAYASDIKPWDTSYTQRELSKLFYGGNMNRNMSWYVAVDSAPFVPVHNAPRAYYIGAPESIEYVPVDVITIGKNLMLP